MVVVGVAAVVDKQRNLVEILVRHKGDLRTYTNQRKPHMYTHKIQVQVWS